ncbi:EAL domain-containing protein [Vibrio crassostreae]|uniref:EAL domain-containing protein n=1 Tax=Vibrio crassostreae TaxID=246167 RepID=UPI001053A709|nr:EAL domain-containing protein [Vibrio crassostreae]TCW20758.1 EAL domain-containing protein (putative c-di-GMP-specific phosphodiesterase class I) [Vibrio crassostreae]
MNAATQHTDIQLMKQHIFTVQGCATNLLEILSRSQGGIDIQIFVNDLERNGRGHTLDTEVLAQLNRHKFPKSQKVLVNLTNSSLNHENFERLIKVLKNNKNSIVVEITESLISWQYAEGINAIMELKSAKIPIALDDFVINSKFSQQDLKRINPNYVKISASSFTSTNNKQLKETINLIRHNIPKAKVVIEGVSDEALFKRAQKIDADYLQGYFFHIPEKL